MVAVRAFRRELTVFVEQALGVEGQRALFIGAASESLARWEEEWRAALGIVSFERFVDGQLRADLSGVKIPGGVVTERVVASARILDRALELVDLYTKVVTGGYKSQTFVYANGGRVSDVRDLEGDDLIVLANVSEFARPAEVEEFNRVTGAPIRGGLFAGIAQQLRREFGSTLNSVYYTWRTVDGRRVPVLAIGGPASFAGRRRAGVDNTARLRASTG